MYSVPGTSGDIGDRIWKCTPELHMRGGGLWALLGASRSKMRKRFDQAHDIGQEQGITPSRIRCALLQRPAATSSPLDSARSIWEARSPSLVVRPHPKHLDDSVSLEDLIDEAVLDSDPAGVGASEITE